MCFFHLKNGNCIKNSLFQKKNEVCIEVEKNTTFSFTFFLRTISPDDVSQQKGIVLLLCVVYLRY